MPAEPKPPPPRRRRTADPATAPGWVRLTTRGNWAAGLSLFVWEALHRGRLEVLTACLALICLAMGLGRLATTFMGRGS